MADMKYSLAIDLAGNLATRARTMQGALGRLSAGGQQDLRRLGRAARSASDGLASLGNRYTALLTGAGAAAAIRQVASLQDQLAALRTSSGRSADEIKVLRERLFEIANNPAVRLDVSQLTAGLQEVYTRSSVLLDDEEGLLALGAAMRATGGDATSMGQLIANAITNLGIDDRGELIAYLSTINEQGKLAKLTLAELAREAPTIAAAYMRTGRTGLDAGREAMALAQIARASTGSGSEAATAVEGLMRTLSDPDVKAALGDMGIQVMDPENLNQMRAVPDILRDIVRATKGEVTESDALFKNVFTEEGAQAVLIPLLDEYRKTGELRLLDGLMEVEGTREQLFQDAAIRAETMSAALTSLSNAWQKFADQNLSGPIDDLARAISDLDPDTLDKTMRALAIGAGTLGALVVGNQVVRTGAAVTTALSMRRMAGAAGPTLAGAAAGMGPTPVLVTNWPRRLGGGRAGAAGAGMAGAAGAVGAGGMGSAGATAAGTAALGQRLRLRLIGRAGGVTALGLGAVEAGMALADGDTRGAVEAGGGALGAAGGAWVGAQVGGALGAATGPLAPVMAPAGALGGAIAGGIAGSEIGREIADAAIEQLEKWGVGIDEIEISVTNTNPGVAAGLAVRPHRRRGQPMGGSDPDRGPTMGGVGQ
ncbi:phage tail tape measure protein [Roseospira navarrensis]|uniref:Phage tail tape measure protein domain-containing protein n=1 Tax=Roseospira navarrensis TaxID=140058 RepID=A0A7X1ZE13_9PROT|nr:phage tail tape measure protein [Roseospira navarrensis]MQX36815.1 hypothetical protein [Roseospira navarrensis]